MDLDDLIISVFCLIDESLPMITDGRRLRQRGPQPSLHDSEVLTMEVVGCYLGLTQDHALCAYFQRHWGHFFPALRRIHRTTVVRQAANLWALKEHLWQLLLTVLSCPMIRSWPSSIVSRCPSASLPAPIAADASPVRRPTARLLSPGKRSMASDCMPAWRGPA